MMRFWTASHKTVRAFADHPDPLAEAANWVALTIGSHLPFWPLYVFWIAGRQSLPSALLTMSMAPLFLAVPLVSRRSSLGGRMTMLGFGLINTVLTVWVLGPSSGTEVFLVPCAVLAALLFRRSERLLMLAMTAAPLLVWSLLREYPPTPLHQYDAPTASHLVVLNVWSIAILIMLFGWFQADIYRKMETRRP